VFAVAVPPPERNKALAALVEAHGEQVRASVQPVVFSYPDVLFDIDDHVDCLFFPASAIISLLATGLDGREVEVAMVGREGFAGVPAYLGQARAPLRARVQHPGTIYSLPLAALEKALGSPAPCSAPLNSYVRLLIRTLAQAGYCRAVHSSEQQVARWLLSFLDRLDGNSFNITHESLARMLGVRRATITHTALNLQSRGAINYDHGHVTVTSRQELEAAVCECYEIIRRDEY
jgi:CRP-like cAMP-binding protein